jgi:hypothetical protein
MPQINAQLFIEALHRLEEQQDLDTISGLYADGAQVSNPVVPHHHRGLPGARDFWQGYRSTFREIHSEFHNVLDDGKTAMLEWTSSGRANDGRPTLILAPWGRSLRRHRHPNPATPIRCCPTASAANHHPGGAAPHGSRTTWF